MRLLIKLSVLLLILATTGCKKDKDDDKSPTNYFTYDGATYELSQGFLENYGQWGMDEGFNLDVTLVSKGLTAVEAGGELTSLSGTGDVVFFELYSTTGGELVADDYVYDIDSFEPGTFEFGGLMIGFTGPDQFGQGVYFTAGTVKIKKSGSQYEISFDCTTTPGKNATGYFKGNLKYYNYDVKKSEKQEKRPR
jgi:hypothetical protein